MHADFLGAVDAVLPAEFALVFLRIRLDALGVGAAVQTEAGIVQVGLAAMEGVGHAFERDGIMDFHGFSFQRNSGGVEGARV